MIVETRSYIFRWRSRCRRRRVCVNSLLSCLTFRSLTHLPCIFAHALISRSLSLVIFCEVGLEFWCKQGKETACGGVGNLYLWYELGWVPYAVACKQVLPFAHSTYKGLVTSQERNRLFLSLARPNPMCFDSAMKQNNCPEEEPVCRLSTPLLT